MSRSPRIRLRCAAVIPSVNSFENMPTACSSRPSFRRPSLVKATLIACSSGRSWAGVRALDKEPSQALPPARSAIATRTKLAAARLP